MRPVETDSNLIALDQLDVGAKARVSALSPELPQKLSNRLMALGFVPGTPFKVMRRAPLGDPIEFELRGGRISLRRSEARHLYAIR